MIKGLITNLQYSDRFLLKVTEITRPLLIIMKIHTARTSAEIHIKSSPVPIPTVHKLTPFFTYQGTT